MEIRAAFPQDSAAIDAVLETAFAGTEEVRLVNRLRVDGLVTCELIATNRSQVVGHVMFSRLTVRAGGEIRADALAPLAVMPSHQRQGIGASLVNRGLETVRRLGTEAVIVLGHPEYYPRFGFSAELAAGLQAPFAGDAFMALEFVPGVLTTAPTIVTYPAAFGLPD